MDNQQITGEESYYPIPSSTSSKGITIRQEAILRFMLIFAGRYHDHEGAADGASLAADAYIKKLNEKPNIPSP